MHRCQPLPNSVINLAIARDIFAGVPRSPDTDAEARPLHLSEFASRLESVRAEDGLEAWQLGNRLTLDSFGDLGEILHIAPTLGSALRRFTEAFPLVQSNSTLSLSVHDDKARLDYRVLDPGIWPRRGDSELTIGFLLALLARFGVPKSAVTQIGFEHQPDRGAANLAQHMLCRTSFDRRENYIVFPAQALSCKNLSTGESERVQYEDCWRSVRARLLDGQRDSSVSDKVRKLILGRVGKTEFHQHSVASDLGMSERSLRRSLAQEDTCYKQLLEECRGSYAIAMLRHTGMALSDIAFALGYSDQTAFSRAFAKQFGHPPSELRKQLRSGTAANAPDD